MHVVPLVDHVDLGLAFVATRCSRHALANQAWWFWKHRAQFVCLAQSAVHNLSNGFPGSVGQDAVLAWFPWMLRQSSGYKVVATRARKCCSTSLLATFRASSLVSPVAVSEPLGARYDVHSNARLLLGLTPNRPCNKLW